jgi:hypothetical protein
MPEQGTMIDTNPGGVTIDNVFAVTMVKKSPEDNP